MFGGRLPREESGVRNGNEEHLHADAEGFVIISEVIAPSLNLPEMIALLALSGAFVAPLPSRATARARRTTACVRAQDGARE